MATDIENFREMINKQQELMDRYGPIERKQGFWYPIFPADKEVLLTQLADHQFQTWVRLRCWFVTEELVEAFTAILQTDKIEELIDALHFMLEMSVPMGFGPAELNESWKSVPVDMPQVTVAWKTIEALGSFAHSMKNKPWKQTKIEPSPEVFKIRLQTAWMMFFDLLSKSGLNTSDKLLAAYSAKHQVNRTRQDTGY